MSRLRLALIGLMVVALVVSITFIACRWEYHGSVQIAKITQWQTADAVYQTQDIYTRRIDWYPSIQPYPMESLFSD